MADAITLDSRHILHLGAGEKYDPLAINVDLVAATKPDVVHNLDNTPWPFPDNRFDEIRAFDVIEHLHDIVRTVEEMHRVCRPNAVIKITVPHFSCANAYIDPTHRHFFSAASFNYFTGDNEFGFYSAVKFKKRAANIVFRPTLTNRLVSRYAARWPMEYEQRWAWIFPAWFMYYELLVDKP